MLPPPLPTQVEVLQHVLDRVSMAAADGGIPPIVVFGVDGALYDARSRTLQILLDYAELVETEDPELTEALNLLTTESIHYLLSDTLRECSITHAEVVHDITNFWREHFYSDEYALLDEPVPGAVEYVQTLYRAGAGIVYLSGRDIPGMLLGTIASLRNHGFPVAEVGVQVVLKPDATLGTEEFKRAILPKIGLRGDVIAVFTDKVPSCEIAKRIFPGAHVGLVDTWTADPLESDSEIDLIRDFRMI